MNYVVCFLIKMQRWSYSLGLGKRIVLTKQNPCRYGSWVTFIYLVLLIKVQFKYKPISTVNSRLADTSLLRTPRYYGQQLNLRRKLQTFDWNKLPLLRTYGHFIRSQRHNFIVFSLVIADTVQHLGIFTHISSLFFLLFEIVFVFFGRFPFLPSINQNFFVFLS